MRYFGDTFYHDIPYTVCVCCPSCQKLILRNSTAEKQYNLKSKVFIILLYDTESVSFSEFVKKNHYYDKSGVSFFIERHESRTPDFTCVFFH